MENSESLPFFECDVKTWCHYKRDMITLTLRSNKPFKSELVKGKPVFCNCQDHCGHKNDAQCLLNAIMIETKRG